MIENVIIIGGGPAGLSAAIYLARANLDPLVFAGSPPGGQLTLTSEVENYPGFESILGSELIEKMKNQAKKFGARIKDENVKSVEIRQSRIDKIGQSQIQSDKISKNKTDYIRFHLITSDSIQLNPITSKSIIIATGAKALWLNLPSETRLRGKGVSACATCDGFFFREKIVAVVGGGDTALEEALTLTKFAKKVYIIHRRDFFRASKIMQERVFANKKIEIIWNAVVEEIIGKMHVEGIKIRQSQIQSDKISKNKTDYIRFHLITSDSIQLNPILSVLNVDGVFVAIGHKPDTDIFKGQVEMDERGYIITSTRKAIDKIRHNQMKSDEISKNKTDYIRLNPILSDFNFDYQRMTSILGVFVAGDCADPYYRQAVTAAGTGVEAALEVEKYLESN